MIICKRCNTQLTDDSRFCYKCGAPTNDTVGPLSEPETNELTEEPSMRNFHPSERYSPVQDDEPLPAIVYEPEYDALPPVSPIPYMEQQTSPVPNPASGPIPNWIPGQTSKQSPDETSFPDSAYAPYPALTNQPAGVPVKKPIRKRPIIFVVTTVVLIMIVFAAILVPKIISKFTDTPMGIVYIKGNGISYTSVSRIKPKEITEDLFDYGSYIGGTSIGDTYPISTYISYSEDRKRMFYPENIKEGYSSATIYYCNVDSNSPKETKVDDDITYYVINRKGTKVYYLKGTEGDFYFSNLLYSNKIDNNVSEFYLDDTGNRLVYVTNDGVIYIKDGDKDREIVDNNITSLTYVSDDLKTIYYIKNHALYVKKENKDQEKIISDLSEVQKIYATGEIYYTRSSEFEMKLADFVNDDMADTDAAMEEPTKPAYPNYDDYKPSTSYPVEPSYSNYSDFWGYINWDSYYDAYDEYSAQVDEYNKKWSDAYNAAIDQYDSDYEEYTKKDNEYQEKLQRDELRDSLSSQTITLAKYSLYYYANGKSSKLTDNYNSFINANYDKPVLVYANNKQAEFNKINLSKVTSYEDVNNFAMDSTATKTEVSAAVKSKVSQLSQENEGLFSINADADKIYFYKNYNANEGIGDVYSVNINGTSISNPALCEKNVNYFQICHNGKMLYYKNANGLSGDLYLDKEKIDSNVYLYSLYTFEDNEIIYETNYDDQNSTYRLKMYQGKKSVDVAADVSSFYQVNDKQIAYITDYNSEEKSGDVYLYNGSDKNKLVDEGVSAFLYIDDNYRYGGIAYVNNTDSNIQ